MNWTIFSIVVGVLAVVNSVMVVIFNKKRQALDLSKPEDAKKDKTLKLITMILPMETIFLVAILYFIMMGNHS